MQILHFPLIRITIWYVFGVIIAYLFSFKASIAFGLLGLVCFVFLFTFLFTKKIYNQSVFFGIILYLTIFLVGIARTIITKESIFSSHYIHQKKIFNEQHLYLLSINEKLKSSSNYDRYIAELIQVDKKKLTGKIILNIKKEKENLILGSGNKIKLECKLDKNFNPKNPNQFDYRKYLNPKAIYAQLTTSYSEIKVSTTINKTFNYYADKIRIKIINNLSNSGIKKGDLAMFAALLLGQKQEIDAQILQDYQYAGAIHILSVSGLHIGLILIFVTQLLKLLPKNRKTNFINICITLFSLWSFAFIAGFVPSVTRSVTMFSFLVIGRFINKETNIFHSLFISMFLILLYHPLFLFDIGFQLSYLALFFIIWLQPLLNLIWKPKNKIIAYCWGIICVSFAAQIGTMPLCIYYFHQFPSLFFITNLVLIPMLSIIMPLGFFLIGLAYFNFIPIMISNFFVWCIDIINSFVRWIASFEEFVFKDIYISFSFCLLLYLFIVAWTIWFKKPNYKRLLVVLFSIILLQLSLFLTDKKVKSIQELIVFNICKKTIISERIGKEVIIFTNANLKDNSNEKKIVDAYLKGNTCNLTQKKPIVNVNFFNNKKILIIDKWVIYDTSLRPDIILLINSPKINLDRLLLKHQPKWIIADASNFKSYVKLWQETCKKRKILFHSTYEKGFIKL